MRKAVLAFVILATTSPCFSKYSGGTGEPNDPYQIGNVVDLLAMAADTADYTKCFILKDDLDFDPYLPGGQVFTRAVIAWDGVVAFKGVFDGNGHTIKNMTMPPQSDFHNYVGLFGRVDSASAQIKNLGLINPDINLLEYHANTTGALIGQLMRGNVTNCYVKGGRVNGDEIVGGLIGISIYGDIEDCYADCNVYGKPCVGGLIGDSRNLVSGCYANGSVSGMRSTGGLMGQNYMGTVTSSYATGLVIGRNGGLPINTGGLIGELYEGTVTDCFATGTVTGITYVGGLTGVNTGAYLIRCYATGNVTGITSVGGLTGGHGDNEISQCFAEGNVSGNSKVGGLVGGNSGYITNSLANGNVSGNDRVGGLIGYQDFDGMLTKSYSAGAVWGGSGVGGMIGQNDDGYIEKSFWDINTSGQAASDGGTGKTTVEMKTKNTFTDAGWDFINEIANGTDDIWKIDEGLDYPRLAWEGIPPQVVSWEIAEVYIPWGALPQEVWCVVENGYVEPRSYGIKKLRVCFDTDMNTSPSDISEAVTIEGANGGTQAVSGQIIWESSTCMVILLTSALPDKDTYTITLTSSIKSASGVGLEETSMCLTALKGDANGDRSVTAGDLLAVRAKNNQPVNSSTARYDINCDGFITAGDLLATRVFIQNFAPPCP